jgi:hypothetical protein
MRALVAQGTHREISDLLGAGEGHQTIVSHCPPPVQDPDHYQQVWLSAVFPCPTMCATIRVVLWDQTWDGWEWGA